MAPLAKADLRKSGFKKISFSAGLLEARASLRYSLPDQPIIPATYKKICPGIKTSPSWPRKTFAPKGSIVAGTIRCGRPSSPHTALLYLSNLATACGVEAALALSWKRALSEQGVRPASTPQAVARFERYSKAVCGDDGLPHLIVPATIEPFGANVFRGHEGDVLIPGHIFLYVAGIIGWSGREYLKLARASSNPAENEIFLNPDFLRSALAKGAMWPLEADKEARSGLLRESNNKITTSPESDFSKVSF
jgi:photosystem I subunit 3